MDGEELWMTSMLDRYLARPLKPEFENICFATFASEYRVCTHSKADKQEMKAEDQTKNQRFQLQHDLGSVMKRTQVAIIRYPRFNKEKDSERYFENIIRLYYPHRKRNLKTEDETFETIFTDNQEIILQNMRHFEKLSSELDEAWQKMQEDGPQEEAWAELAPQQEEERIQHNMEKTLEEDYEQIDLDDIPDLDIPTHLRSTSHSQPKPVPYVQQLSNRVTEAQHKESLRSLNVHQQKLFYFIRDWALKKSNKVDVEPFHIFLTGGAGTGKSHLIKCIFQEVKDILPVYSDDPDSVVVLLLAPTGTAAFGINGQTIHSAFAINKATSNVLSEDKINTLRSKYLDLQLLIIDEISMVSQSLLETLHCRLQQLKQSNSSKAFFGNLSILAVGDFFQVPPTMQRPLCLDTNKLTNLWSLFYIWELQEVVRQKNDLQFVEMLNRFRKRKKEDPILAEDIALLQQQLVDTDEDNYPFSAIHIFSTNNQLNIHNDLMINKLENEESQITITAVDVCIDQGTHTTYKRKEPLSVKGASLPAAITVAEGARVMVITNIDVSDGLTNGAMGTITSIIQGDKPLGQPAAICILFDNGKVGSEARKATPPPTHVNQNSTVIQPQTEQIQTKPYQVTRHQYPLRLAWAVTIHKTQGMTTEKAVVSLDKIFLAGQAYVALSRVTSLKGLFLTRKDFNIDAIYCNPKIEKALSLMPSIASQPSWKKLQRPEMKRYKANHISLVSHNTQGLLAHLKDIKFNQFIQENDIIALQETWLTDKQCKNLVNPFVVHSIVYYNRKSQSSSQQSPGGGVALLIHQDFDFELIDTSKITLECLAVEIVSPSMTVCNIYRPPSVSIQEFCNQLMELLSTIKTEKIIVVGDFNMDILKGNSEILSDVFSDYQQVISSATTKGNTLLDHIYVKNVEVAASGVCPTYYSYHDMTYVISQT